MSGTIEISKMDADLIGEYISGLETELGPRRHESLTAKPKRGISSRTQPDRAAQAALGCSRGSPNDARYLEICVATSDDPVTRASVLITRASPDHRAIRASDPLDGAVSSGVERRCPAWVERNAFIHAVLLVLPKLRVEGSSPFARLALRNGKRPLTGRFSCVRKRLHLPLIYHRLPETAPSRGSCLSAASPSRLS